jgi:hypothetical protein
VALEVQQAAELDVRELLARPSVFTWPGLTSSVIGSRAMNRATSPLSSLAEFRMMSSNVLRLTPVSRSSVRLLSISFMIESVAGL